MNNVFSIKAGSSVSHINLDGPDPLSEFERVIAGQDEYRVVGFPLADELGLKWESYTTFHQAQNMMYHLNNNGPLAFLLYLRKCRASGMVAERIDRWGDIAGRFTGAWSDMEEASKGHLNYFLTRISNITVRAAVRECLDWRMLAKRAEEMGVVWFFEQRDMEQQELGVVPDLNIPPIIKEMERSYAKCYPKQTVSTYYPLTTLFTGTF